MLQTGKKNGYAIKGIERKIKVMLKKVIAINGNERK